MSTKDETGGSQAGGNGVKLAGWWFGSIKGERCSCSQADALDVGQGSLVDST